jgi:pilus assembly protein CpaF
MAQLEDPGELVRARVEHALAAEQVNLTSEQGRHRAGELIDETLRSYQAEALAGDGDATPALLQRLRQELRDDLLGLGAIAERMLHDERAHEWMVNGVNRIFVDTGERIERVTDFGFRDERQLRGVLERLLEHAEGKRLDRITPLVEARLPDGSRLTAAIPPISSNGHTTFVIRRFRLGASSPKELVALGSISQQAMDFLSACVRARKNIVVCGPANTGKTTLLNALGQAIPPAERVVVCEAAAELKLAEVLPNCVTYEARDDSPDGLPAVTLDRLIQIALRMNPDRIILGECLSGPATNALLWSFATGHAGMTSIHGETCEHALRNLVRFALTSGHHITSEQALDWLNEVHIVVHCSRPPDPRGGGRYLPRHVDEIVEVQGIEGNRPTLNPLFQGAGANLRWLAAGPRFLAQLQQVGYQPPQ